jgi:hypothetical protein
MASLSASKILAIVALLCAVFSIIVTGYPILAVAVILIAAAIIVA